VAVLIVEDGSGISNANSYLSVADADDYHDLHGAPAAWTAAVTADKEAALRLATQYIDGVYGSVWQGRRELETQALDWPRCQVWDYDGFPVSFTIVPQQVKDACAYLALKQISGDTLLPDDASASNVTSEAIQLGALSISQSFSGTKTTTKYYRLVEKILAELTTGTGRIYRS